MRAKVLRAWMLLTLLALAPTNMGGCSDEASDFLDDASEELDELADDLDDADEDLGDFFDELFDD